MEEATDKWNPRIVADTYSGDGDLYLVGKQLDDKMVSVGNVHNISDSVFKTVKGDSHINVYLSNREDLNIDLEDEDKAYDNLRNIANGIHVAMGMDDTVDGKLTGTVHVPKTAISKGGSIDIEWNAVEDTITDVTADNGFYSDFVLKLGRFEEKYQINADGESNRARYDVTGLLGSLELGKEIEINEKYYFKPYGKLSYMRLGSDDYTTSNGIEVHQDSSDNLVGLLGFELVRELEENGEVYFKAEYGKDLHGSISSDLIRGFEETTYKKDLDDSWVEIGLGYDKQLNDNLSIYTEANKSFADDYETDWEVILGFKYYF